MKIKYLLMVNLLINPFAFAQNSTNNSMETIILLRHGEKPSFEYGQISCKGLNRSLQLPQVIKQKFGNIDFFYAPNPTTKIKNKKTGDEYFYLRPFITIEPTAISQEKPVNIQFGYEDVQKLTNEILLKKYFDKKIVVAWEHLKLVDIAKDIFKEDSSNDPKTIPNWVENDFDSFYILTINRDQNGKISKISFKQDKEDITNKISDKCPA